VLLGALEEREGWLDREGWFHWDPQPQKRGGKTDTIIQSQREQLWRPWRRVNSFSSRHPKTTNAIVSGYSSYNNVASRLFGESKAIYRVWSNPFCEDRSKTACWVSIIGPIFLQSEYIFVADFNFGEVARCPYKRLTLCMLRCS
jgi:hypothetical protein